MIEMNNRKRFNFACWLITAVLLGGCAGMGEPQNATDFRNVVRNSPFKSMESFEVARPLAQVAATLRKLSAQCLDISIKWTGNRGVSGVTTYKPTFIANSRKAELHVQRKKEGGMTTEIVIGGERPNGTYRAVLDATAVSQTHTKIDLYLWSAIDDKLLGKALKGWAKGDNLGCPDL